MKNEYTAVVKQEDEWWAGWIEEVPGVNCQEKTYQELKENLVVTLKEKHWRLIGKMRYLRLAADTQKKKELLKYLRSQGCDLLREGGRHSW